MDTNSSSTNDEEKPRSCRCVDIGTKERANEFLKGVSSFDIFSSNVKKIRELRKKTQLNVDDEEKLKRLYGNFACLAANADEKFFRAKIPESEIQDWLNLVIEEIKSFTTNQNWISTGRLDNYCDYGVLSCALIMFKHVVPVYLAFKSEFFQVLANFIKARKGRGGGALPDVTICDYIGRIVSLSFLTVNEHFGDHWPEAKIFKIFEESGILEQFLRCSTVPQTPGENYEILLDRLVSCPDALVVLKSGKPCRDTLKAILDGQDGSRDIQPRILNRLKGVERLVETMFATTCGFCSKKSEAPLDVCGGCRLVFYCSQECQKAHWKKHKKLCGNTPVVILFCMSVDKFIDQNFESMFQALNEECYSTGVEASDLVVEVNFLPNEDGIITALHGSPKFRIVHIRDYISGQDMPEWFRGYKVEGRRRARFEDLVQQRMTKGRSTNSASLLVHYGRRDFFLPEHLEISAE